MQHITRNVIFILIVLGIAAMSIYPPESNLRKGRDLAGGVSLVYSIDLEGVSDVSGTVDNMIDVLKRRVDPDGLYEIAMVRSGRDRLVVSMPLPTDDVKALKQAYLDKIDALELTTIDIDAIDRIVRLTGGELDAQVELLSSGSDEIAGKLRDAASAYRTYQESLLAYNEAVGEEAPQAVIDDLLVRAGESQVAYENARELATQTSLSGAEIEAALALDPDERRIRESDDGEVVELPSPRSLRLDRLKERYPSFAGAIDDIVASYDEYAGKRKGLDDPQDLKRMLRGAGVLNFRIAVQPGEHPEEQRLRQDLREKGARAASADDARWFELQDIAAWYDNLAELQLIQANPGVFFSGRRYVVEERDGLYYMLLYDAPGLAMTQADGDWGVSSAGPGTDEMGRPNIVFTMDPLGARLLGKLTSPNVGRPMAVVLDDRVYTAPNLNGPISVGGQIMGNFSLTDIQYIVRTLSSGSLQAKLNPDPISEEILGPELGADNLQKGFFSAVVALIAVASFMAVYYFTSGFVAVFALFCNAIIILGAMSLNRAAFTLPGIAGIVLTFGMAVDANVLIFERIREELGTGVDLKTAVRLGYDKVLSTIVDANVTNLIVCVVLYRAATPEIRGFAVTLGIGIVATLFSALVISRVIFSLMVEGVGVRRLRQLPMIIPGLQRILSPNLNWLKMRPLFVVISAVLLATGIGLAIKQGPAMFGHQFRGGLSVSLQLKEGLTSTRSEILDRIQPLGEGVAADSPLRSLASAEVLAVAPESDGVTSNRFQVKTVSTTSETGATEAEAREAVAGAIIESLSDLIESSPALRFDGSVWDEFEKAPVFRVLDASLGESVGKPEFANDIGPFVGGVAVLIEDIEPAIKRDLLVTRIEQMRQQPDFSDLMNRRSDLIILEQNAAGEATKAAYVALDPDVDFFSNEDRWRTDVAQREWMLVKTALTEPATTAAVQSFSPQIAQTFKAQAISAIVLSFLGILVYVWVRFGSLRYSLAAIVAILHDVIAVVGLIALAEVLYEFSPGLASRLLMEPFKIDLGLIAALLTIIGYSLNDTIVILDRIRENRGKLAYASADVINKSINQTFSRTIITSGTTLIAVLIMYVIGGEGIRSFTYALLCGVLVGTYSSVAIASPMVYSKKTPPSARPREARSETATGTESLATV